MFRADHTECQDNLVCPLCLDTFKDAALLTCGHTFCRRCLREYDRNRGGLDDMICPVCRTTTVLPNDKRVDGLLPNLAMIGLVQKSHNSKCSSCGKAEAVSFCKSSKMRLCKLCSEGHHIMLSGCATPEVFTRKMATCCQKDTTSAHHNHRSKIKDLKQQYHEKKHIHSSSLTTIESQQKDTQTHIKGIESQIQETFACKVKHLEDERSSLLGEVSQLRESLDDEFKKLKDYHKGRVQEMENCMTLITAHQTGKGLNRNGMVTTTLIYSDLENLLNEDVKDDPADIIKETAIRAAFHPADEGILALGELHLTVEQERRALGNTDKGGSVSPKPIPTHIQVIKFPSAEQQPPVVQSATKSRLARIETYLQPPVKKHWPSLIRTVDLSSDMQGMAVLSHDRVVIAYNIHDVGCNIVSTSGATSAHLQGRVKTASDIAFLADGRTVIAHGGDLRVYNADGSPTNLRFRSMVGSDASKVATDQWDNIYAVNGNNIQVYNLRSVHPHRSIPTCDQRPRQICLTNLGIMVTSSCDITPSTVAVYDSNGQVQSTIQANHNREYLYATTDGNSKVYVARVAESSANLRLVVYTLTGGILEEQTVFEEVELSDRISFLSSWCYMVCLAPDMVAFAHKSKLYFFKIPQHQE